MQREHERSVSNLQYAWPTNLAEYEAKVFMGLTTMEAIGAALGFLIPLAAIQSLGGLFVGLGGALLVLGCIKRLEHLGGTSLPVYLARRAWEGRRRETLELPLIVGGDSGPIVFESWEGATLMVLGEGVAEGQWAAEPAGEPLIALGAEVEEGQRAAEPEGATLMVLEEGVEQGQRAA